VDKHVADLLSELRPLIADNKLFLAFFRRITFNGWLQLYHLLDDHLQIFDIVLFDIEEKHKLNEVIDPDKLHRVLSFDISESEIDGKKTAVVQLDVAGTKEERKIFFSEVAFYVKVARVHRSDHS
jgi:hypothetical protein